MLDETLAEVLRRRLRGFDVQARSVDGHVELEVALRGKAETRINDVLHTVDRWLVSSGVASVQVHLDGTTYTLHAPAEVEVG